MNNERETTLPPTEPFACPQCGQMLAASCQVCVACKAPVDFTKVGKTPPPETVAPELISRPREIEPARFSWGIFFGVFLAYFFLASMAQGFLGFKGSTYAMGGFVMATSLWVFADARQKAIPKPAGWALACLLLWIVFFPWYLSRRRTPEAPCPTIEGETGPIARALILVLILMTVLGAFLMFSSGEFALK